MLVLALDSAGDGCAACVWQDGHVLAHAEERMERGQDRRLMPLVLSVMEKSGTGFDQLDRIAVTRGPGSFTGLRIGLAAARGIGLAAHKPVIGIDRFSIFRAQNKTANQLLVVINSKRKELYCRFYEGSNAAEPVMMIPEEIAEFLKDKNGTMIVGDARLDSIAHAAEMEAVTCASLAAETDPAGEEWQPRPLYIRPPDVTVKAPRFETADRNSASLLAQLHAESFGDARWSLDQLQGSLALDTTKAVIAFHNNEPAGFILCQTMPGESEILTFCVRPSHQRRGIGEKLLNEIIVSQQSGSLFLEVAADNSAAIALYKKAGFRETGRRPGYYMRGTEAVDAVMFTLTVGAA